MMIKYLVLIRIFIFVIGINGGILVSDKIDFESNKNTESDVIIDDEQKYYEPSSNIQSDEFAFREHEFVKPKWNPGHFESVHNSIPLTIVNNIRIIFNGNESQVTPTSKNKCKDNICDVAVSTFRDKNGNLVTTLQLSVITKINDFKVNDIPIIDGIHGLSHNDATDDDKYPNSNNNNVPQIYRHGLGNFQPSFGVRRNNFYRPSPPDPYYSFVGARHGDEYQGHEQNRWLTGKDLIDDKIEMPLSNTASQ